MDGTTIGHALHSQQNKRVACNRCRAQKLKCLRPEEYGGLHSDKCIRCTKADVECNFSVSKRGAKPRATSLKAPQSSVSHDTATKTARQIDDVVELQASQADTSTVDEDMGRETSQTGATGREVHPALHDKHFDVFSTDLESAFDPSSFDFLFNNHNWNLTSPAETCTPFPGPESLDIASTETNIISSATGTPVPSHYNHPISRCSNSISIPTKTQERSEASMVQGYIGSQPSSAQYSTLATSRVSLTSDWHKKLMEELADLAMSLYSQIIQHENTRTDIDDQFIGDVLRSSTTFLRILTYFEPSDGALPASVKTLHADSLSNSFGSRSESPCSIINTVSSTQTDVGMANDPEMRRPQPQMLQLDVTTVFQLLTSYIRLVRLHSIMYSAICEHLTAMPGKVAQLHPIFPDLCVGGVSLDAFGNFQVKFLLQINLHILGQIEMALGLPGENRISSKTSRKPGILETSVSPQLVKMALKEQDSEGLGVKSIREKITRMRHILRGTINI